MKRITRLFYAALLLLVLPSWASPVISGAITAFGTPELADQHIAYPNALIQMQSASNYNRIWHGNVYTKAFLGVCDPDHARTCVEYVYAALNRVFDNQLSYRDLLAITYYGELGIYSTPYSHLKLIAHQALARNFFDLQSGGCRFNHNLSYPNFDCRYNNLIDWLSTSQHWRDAVTMVGSDHVRVNIERLIGVKISDIGDESVTRGYLAYDQDVVDIIFAPTHFKDWRNGQGYDVPSVWGNTRLAVGATQYIHPEPSEDEGHIIVHYYDDGQSPTLNEDIEGQPTCTLVSIITTVAGRLTKDAIQTCQP